MVLLSQMSGKQKIPLYDISYKREFSLFILFSLYFIDDDCVISAPRINFIYHLHDIQELLATGPEAEFLEFAVYHLNQVVPHIL